MQALMLSHFIRFVLWHRRKKTLLLDGADGGCYLSENRLEKDWPNQVGKRF